jgi:hypothetical protein
VQVVADGHLDFAILPSHVSYADNTREISSWWNKVQRFSCCLLQGAELVTRDFFPRELVRDRWARGVVWNDWQVKVGGLLAGKDYYTGVVDHWPGGSQVVFVRDAVDEFAARKGARVYSTYTDPHDGKARFWYILKCN